MKESDKYIKLVEWSEEDKCYVGSCPSLMLGGVHGDDEAKVYKELCEVVDEWIENYRRDGDKLPEQTAGRTFSGKFVFRVGSELHRELYIEALRQNESLNSFCLGLVSRNRQQRNNPARRK
jgi:predicted HicB family RNase H-like nuclease